MTIDSQRLQRLAEMGIVSWQQRQCASTSPEVTIPVIHAGASHENSVPSSDIESLRAQVRDCQQCELHQSRTQTVFGSGSLNARLFIIGEAPGADEDASGEPFVGRAGKLLNSMLEAIGLKRDEVYIANILKCRPPGNRDPKPEEVAQCRGYLERQINLLEPQLILAIGRVAAQNLLAVSTPIGKLRGSEYQYPGSTIPVLITYHPAYLLRSPREKRKAWDDLKRVALALGI